MSCLLRLSSQVGDDVGERGRLKDNKEDCARGGFVIIVVEGGQWEGGETSLLALSCC